MLVRRFETSYGEIEFLETKSIKYGHLTSNVAFKLAKELSRNPIEIANEIAKEVERYDIVRKVEVANGFINIYFDDAYLKSYLFELAKALPDAGFEEESYPPGSLRKLDGKFNLEFVSANPTGPLNVVNARAGSIGDSLCRIGRFLGYDVEAEYYVNDEGTQIEMLGWSILYHLGYVKEEELPEDAYRGEYVKEIAQAIKDSIEDPKNIYEVGKLGASYILRKQMEALSRFRISYDNVVKESDIRRSEYPKRVLRILKEKELLFLEDKQGKRYALEELYDGDVVDLLDESFYRKHLEGYALYIRTTEFYDTKDRVLIRSNGQPTYFFWDIAYHLNKIERGYDVLRNFLGPDHHGYIDRLRSALKALGFEELEIFIVQQTNLLEGGRKVRMSKRKGKIYTMDELLDEVGIDAARFFFLMRSPSAHLDFDIELAKHIGKENPVYYVQYVHARIESMKRNAKAQNISWSLDDLSPKDYETEHEMELMRKLLYFQIVLEKAFKHAEPHHVVHYLISLADDFHSFYQNVRVIDLSNVELTRKRLAFLDVLGKTVGVLLNLIGVKAPDRM